MKRLGSRTSLPSAIDLDQRCKLELVVDEAMSPVLGTMDF